MEDWTGFYLPDYLYDEGRLLPDEYYHTEENDR